MTQRGFLVGYESLEVFDFQLNPTNITDGKAANFAAVVTPAGSQPQFPWVSGDKRTIGFTLRYYFSEADQGKVQERCNRLLSLQYPEVERGRTKRAPERVLRLATRGGARLLGRDDIGRLEPGAAADLAVFRLDRVDFAGAMHDPAAAILYCGSGVRADYTIVAGKVLEVVS